MPVRRAIDPAAGDRHAVRELESVAYQLSSRRIDDLGALRKWLAVLVAPGASLGGARPKANFTEADGSLWIGKFPAQGDDRDVGAWEYLVHGLAIKAGVDVPAAKLLRLNNDSHTFCIQRFDRVGGARRFNASAMTLLRKSRARGQATSSWRSSFAQRATGPTRTRTLRSCSAGSRSTWEVGNRDDHLRNHGFVLGATGWRLAPAFDVNPNFDKAEHVLNIDDSDSRPSLETVLTTARFFGLAPDRAEQTVEEVACAIDGWRDAAQRAGIAGDDVELTAGAFAAHTEYRARRRVSTRPSRKSGAGLMRPGSAGTPAPVTSTGAGE